MFWQLRVSINVAQLNASLPLKSNKKNTGSSSLRVISLSKLASRSALQVLFVGERSLTFHWRCYSPTNAGQPLVNMVPTRHGSLASIGA